MKPIEDDERLVDLSARPAGLKNHGYGCQREDDPEPH